MKIKKKHHKVNHYADDTSVFMKATEENLKLVLCTGWFKDNITKTKNCTYRNYKISRHCCLGKPKTEPLDEYDLI